MECFESLIDSQASCFAFVACAKRGDVADDRIIWRRVNDVFRLSREGVMSSRFTVAICLSLAVIGGKRGILFGGTRFIAISVILFFALFLLGGG